MMPELFIHLVFWHWLLLAAFLLIADLITGTGFLFWTGIAAALMSGIVAIFPELSSMWQLLGFAGISIIAAFTWSIYLRKHPIKTDRPTLNRRSEQYVGRVFTLEAPIVNGVGNIRVDDSSWRIRGEDLPKGTQVRVTGVDGIILRVEKISNP